MANKTEIKGTARTAAGKVKQATAKLTGNDRLRARGAADEAAGKTQRTVGTARRNVGKAIAKVGKAVKG